MTETPDTFMGIDLNDTQNVLRLLSLPLMRKAIDVAQSFDGPVGEIGMKNFEASVMLPSPLLVKVKRIVVILPITVEEAGIVGKCASIAFPKASENEPEAVDMDIAPRPLLLVTLVQDGKGGTQVGMEPIYDDEEGPLTGEEQMLVDVMLNLHSQVVDFSASRAVAAAAAVSEVAEAA